MPQAQKTPRAPRAPRLRLEITEELIEAGVTRSSSHCPIAEAVRVAFPEARQISVDLQTIRFTDPKRGLRYIYLTPRVGQVGLVSTDDGVRPAPYSMTIQGGQVVKSGQSTTKLTEAQLEQRKKAAALGRAKMVNRGSTRSVPDRVGGRTPPSSNFAKRRAFGLRDLHY